MAGSEVQDAVAPPVAVSAKPEVVNATTANNMYFWSYADDLVVTLALLALIRTLFYITRGRTGRRVKPEAAVTLLKFWCSFMTLRLGFELLEDFMPGLVYVTTYQVLKVLVFTGVTVLSTTMAEKFFDKVIKVRLEERAGEIDQLSQEWRNFAMAAMESLIDHLEYFVNWLKRKYIMSGGNMSLQPRQIVLSDEQQSSGRDSAEEGTSADADIRQQGRRRLSSSLGTSDPTFFSGGSGFSASSRSLSQRMQALADNWEERDARVDRKKRASLSTDDVRAGSDRSSGQKELSPYEKIKVLRKQMRDGSLKKSGNAKRS